MLGHFKFHFKQYLSGEENQHATCPRLFFRKKKKKQAYKTKKIVKGILMQIRKPPCMLVFI